MLIDDVQQAMFAAMKARQAEETAALRLALSALKSAAIDARKDLADDEAVAVLQREARKRREAEQAYRDAGRAERADQEAYERSVLERFLPANLDPAELARLVDEAVATSGATGPKELGKVMGRLMPQVKGRADGNEVRRLVLERLGGRPASAGGRRPSSRTSPSAGGCPAPGSGRRPGRGGRGWCRPGRRSARPS